MREFQSHAIRTSLLEFSAQHHALYRYARRAHSVGRSSRELDNGAQVCARLNGMRQFHVKAEHAEIDKLGANLKLSIPRIYALDCCPERFINTGLASPLSPGVDGQSIMSKLGVDSHCPPFSLPAVWSFNRLSFLLATLIKIQPEGMEHIGDLDLFRGQDPPNF